MLARSRTRTAFATIDVEPGALVTVCSFNVTASRASSGRPRLTVVLGAVFSNVNVWGPTVTFRSVSRDPSPSDVHAIDAASVRPKTLAPTTLAELLTDPRWLSPTMFCADDMAWRRSTVATPRFTLAADCGGGLNADGGDDSFALRDTTGTGGMRKLLPNRTDAP